MTVPIGIVLSLVDLDDLRRRCCKLSLPAGPLEQLFL